jgi:tRNA dimethylallyltransferase
VPGSPPPPSIVAVVGPTAAGKSAVALAVAERAGAEIVSCDSMQLYRGLDIGTAKPTAAERARVRHHLVDLLAPDASYSAARFAADADAALADIHGRGRRALLVGGTGLYLRALRFGLVEAPPRDDEMRARLLAEEQAQPGVLHRRLAAVDAVAAARLAPADLVRVVRALEVHALTGVPLSQHHAQHRPQERIRTQVLILDPPFEILEARIADRVDAMLAAGLVDETRALRARWGPSLPPLQAVGYAEVGQLLDGQLAAADLRGAIVRATRRYARRQRTWFKKEPGAIRLATADELTRAIDAAWRQ